MDDAPQLPPLPMMPNSGEGREVMDYLRSVLGIPQGARWFEVRFAIGEPITVRVDYVPHRPNHEG